MESEIEEKLSEAQELLEAGMSTVALQQLIRAVKLLSQMRDQDLDDQANFNASQAVNITRLMERIEWLEAEQKEQGFRLTRIEQEQLAEKFARPLLSNRVEILETDNKMLQATLSLQNAALKLQSERIKRLEDADTERDGREAWER